jgi:1,2-phenylacetyl-CoA epoxidase PaaB subunit
MTAMAIWDVLQRRKPDADWEVAGGIKAPDLDMAMLLARETHFRHKEASDYAVRLRGTDEIHRCPDPTGIGGVIDRAYRRSEGYAGVGAKLKKVHAVMKERGLVIDGSRPPVGRPGKKEEAARA